jgi:medium-chain acyl-[acyl-carrier-protein] hydrolase
MDRLTGTRTWPAAGEWAVRWRPTPDARLRLFCLPHAGGGAAVYRSWAHLLAPDIEVIAIRLPGRETRFREPPFTCLDDLVPVLVRQLEPWLDRPYAWFGHSMGALVAFESARMVRRLGLADPVRLFVSGRPAPHLALRYPPIHRAPKAELLSWLQELSGTPPEVLGDPAILSALLPTLRADLTVSETHHCRPEPPLDCPISVFGGTDDHFTTADELRAWAQHSTAADCTVRSLPGGHFFLHQVHQQVLSAIISDVMSDQIDHGKLIM